MIITSTPPINIYSVFMREVTWCEPRDFLVLQPFCIWWLIHIFF